MAEVTVRAGATEQSATSQLAGTDRVLAVLSQLARHPDGIGLDDLARLVASPKPTVHRALAALRRAGFAAQDGRRRYLLGDEFIRLAFANHEARLDHLRVVPILRDLAARHAETAHYAVLEGRSVVYRSKVDPPAGAVRLTSTIGGRNPAHSTALGKVLLAHQLPDDDAVARWVGGARLERRTDRTRTTVEGLCAELAATRDRGYGIEDQETEPGVNCLALPVFLASPTVPSGAVSISALVYRTPLRALVEDLPAIRAIVDRREQVTAP